MRRLHFTRLVCCPSANGFAIGDDWPALLAAADIDYLVARTAAELAAASPTVCSIVGVGTGPDDNLAAPRGAALVIGLDLLTGSRKSASGSEGGLDRSGRVDGFTGMDEVGVA